MSAEAAPDFKDHFSGHAGDYARHRPVYPPQLAEELARRSPGHLLALDCGCGSGQLSVLLADCFDRVVATDASAAQIAHAIPHPRVEYRAAAAERSGLADRSADLIVAAQSAHWFDLPAFWSEVDRVARPGTLVALVSYALMRIGGDLDAIIDDFYRFTIGPYWPPEREMVETGYAGLAFPYAELPPPKLDMTADWSLHQLVGYLSTWSAVKAAERAIGESPLPAVAERLAARWGDPDVRREVRWPLRLRLGRVSS